MAINPKKVTKDKLIEMLTEERGKREALETAENVLRTKLKEACGYTETYSKEIIIDDSEPEEQTLNDLEGFKRKVLRHEIVHAFLHESGLDAGSDWARNEEIVDWIALQFEKMQRAMQEVGALSCGGT